MKNYDLNVWDIWAYETSGKITGGWIIQPYELPYDTAPYGSGQQTEHTLHLRTKDAERMRLGVDTDDDFWLDAESLLDEDTTPRRVRIWLEKLMRGELDGRTSVA